ncbi:MAG TPA: AraC family transcriptional regulator [Cyclobacteriaceae bacterium]|nr:AraC family transcriptional regulator [Cyclobacteriaceae bacterium]
MTKRDGNVKKTKAEFEAIQPTFGSSFFLKQFNHQTQNKAPTWHFHPELELVYVSEGSGRRHIGQHLSYFNDGDLLLIGSNLPHYGFTDRLTGSASETIVQMKPDFLGTNFFTIPEMHPVEMLFERARMGIAFTGETKEKVGAQLKALESLDAYDRLIRLLDVLHTLADSEEYILLNSEGIMLEVSLQDSDRMNTIFNFVQKNFRRSIALEEVADLAHMTVPSFCRFFKKKSGKNFTRFVNEYRLVHASKLLSEETSSISQVCLECGFNNFSHFNKEFKQFTGKSPSAYRNELRKIIA